MKNHADAICRRFTLIETLVVLAIATIITGGALAYMLRSPSSLVLSNAAAALEQLMLTAQSQASLRGVARSLKLDAEQNIFSIDDLNDEGMPKEHTELDHTADDMPPTQIDMLRLDSDIVLEFPDLQERSMQYIFFPDGSASGPELTLSLKNHRRRIRVSRLTGTIHNENITDED
ncbi:MAG: hypothetical protein JW808_02795 [Victivallales bacterium]|nr:hypothetical protein [Victivallales bacterium]